MANIKYKTGVIVGNWEIIEKLESKKYGNPVYLVRNKITGVEKEITTNGLNTVKKRKSTRLSKGRPRKWVYKVDENGFIISKTPYKEN